MGKKADEIYALLSKSMDIRNGNRKISVCPNCNIGKIYNQDSIENIGQCDYCFEEFKLQ